MKRLIVLRKRDDGKKFGYVLNFKNYEHLEKFLEELKNDYKIVYTIATK